MTAPERFLDSPNAVPPLLLQALRGAPAADASALQALASQLNSALNPPAPAPSGTMSSGSVPASGLKAVSLCVLGGMAIGVAVSTVAARWASTPSDSASAPSSALTATSRAALESAFVPQVAPAPPDVSGSAAVEAPAARASSKPSSRAESSPVDEPELALLARARRNLTSSPGEALALCRQHADRFARGVLAQEREVIAIDALQRLGRGAESRRRGEAFLSLYPESAHSRRVRELLAGRTNR